LPPPRGWRKGGNTIENDRRATGAMRLESVGTSDVTVPGFRLKVSRRILQPLVGALLRGARRAVQPPGGAPVAEAWTLPPPPTTHPAPDATPEATLVITSRDDRGHSFQVGRQPVTLGSGQTCAIGLSAAPGVAAEHARIWWRDGRLMLHHLAPGQLTTAVGGRSVTWAVLEHGDEVWIGPHKLSVSTAPAKEVSSKSV
jgi:hypothetical protein